MKKFLALLLVMTMVMSLAACGSKGNTENTTATGDATVATEPQETATYTYDVNLSEFPTLWNPHTYTTNTSSSVMDYIVDSLYAFDYNEDETGFALVPSMATEDPIDITADYVGKYGIEEGDTGRVYKFILRDDLAWEDGTVINAHSFVESAQRLLNPKAQNFRADSLYSGGTVTIVGAEDYLKQGRYAYSAVITDPNNTAQYVGTDAFTVKEDGTYAVEGKGDLWVGITCATSWSSNTFQDYVDAGYLAGVEEVQNLWDTVIAPAANAEGYVAVTEEVMNAMNDVIAVLHGCANSAEYAAACGDDDSYASGNYATAEWLEGCFYGADKGEFSWDDVGIFALSDNELVYVLNTPAAGFDLKYGLPDNYLVHTETYDACESIDENGLYTNTYGTSVETTKSYGPYVMQSFQADKEVHYVRNENHHDVQDGYYQTTDIIIHCIPEDSTRKEMFLSGKLDTYGLQKDDMETYLTSDYTYLSDSASIWGMVFNPNKEALEKTQAAAGNNINKTILSVKEFRMAMSYGMDRSSFSLATMPTCVPAFGLLSMQHIVDTEAGTGYRSTEDAKNVLAEVWGLTDDIGEGKLYATVDDAVDALSGYNPELAKQKFDEAYDIAISTGLMTENDTVQICIGLPTSSSAVYNNGYEFIVNNYKELVKGTKLEGKLEFTKNDTIGDAFGERLRDNTVDMLFYVGFTGSALDPFNLMSVYCDGGNLQYDPCVDYSTVDMTVEINGTAYTATVTDWYDIMNGTAANVTDAEGNVTEYSCGSNDGDPTSRMKILAQFERTVLLNYNFIPLSGDSSAQLVGQQVQYYSDEYLYGVGFGGLKYMTFNYSDAEWDAYVASQNGELDYT